MVAAVCPDLDHSHSSYTHKPTPQYQHIVHLIHVKIPTDTFAVSGVPEYQTFNTRNCDTKNQTILETTPSKLEIPETTKPNSSIPKTRIPKARARLSLSEPESTRESQREPERAKESKSEPERARMKKSDSEPEIGPV